MRSMIAAAAPWLAAASAPQTASKYLNNTPIVAVNRGGASDNSGDSPHNSH